MERFTKRLAAVWLCAAAVTLSACGGDDAPPPPPPPAVGSATLGVAGGTVDGPDGTQLVVSPDSLAGDVTFRLARDATGAPPLEGLNAVSPVYAVTPHGQAFAADALFSIPLATLQLPPGATPILLKAEPGGTWRVMRNAAPDSDRLAADVSELSYFVVGTCSSAPADVWTVGAVGCPSNHELRLTLLDGNSSVQVQRGPNGVQLPLAYVIDTPRTLEFIVDWFRPDSPRVDSVSVLGTNGAFNPNTVEVSGGTFARRFTMTIDPAQVANASGPNGRLLRITAIASYSATAFRIGQGNVPTGFEFVTDIPILVRYSGVSPTLVQPPTPAAVSVVENNSFTLSALATGPGITYQWRYFDNAQSSQAVPAEGVNDQPTYSSPPAPLGWNGRRYQLQVCTNAGAPVITRCGFSAPVDLTVSELPVPTAFTSQPAAADILEGEGSAFTAAVRGTPSPSLRWHIDVNCFIRPILGLSCSGTPLSDGAGSGVLAGATVSGSATGNLQLAGVALGANGTTLALAATTPGVALPLWSDRVTLTVRPRPVAAGFVAPGLQSPRDVQENGSLDFSATLTGTQPISPSWSINGLGVNAGAVTSGACTGASVSFPAPGVMRLSNVPLGCNGAIIGLGVENIATPAGTRPMATALLNVNAVPVAPNVGLQPQAVTVNEGQGASLRVGYGGSLPITLTLQRFVGGNWVDAGSTTSAACASPCTTNTPVLQAEDNGAMYRLRLVNAQGSQVTDAVTVTVTMTRLPQFTTLPAAAAIDAGQNASFGFAVGNDTGSFSYQWLANGQPLVDGSNSAALQGAVVSGASGSGQSGTLSLSNVPLGANGVALSVRVQRSAGSQSTQATTAAALLTVNTGVPADALTATQVVAGHEWSLVLRPDRTVWGWGNLHRNDGQVQVANMNPALLATRPVRLYPAALNDVRQIAGSYDSFWALTGEPGSSGSRVLHWGTASSGGDGRGRDGNGGINGPMQQTRSNEAAPVEVLERPGSTPQPMDRVCAIAGGAARLLMIRAIDSGGTTTSCAAGAAKTAWLVGSLTQYDSDSLGVAVPVPGLPSSLSAGASPRAVFASAPRGLYGSPYSFVLDDGRVYAFGTNFYDALGLGNVNAWFGATSGPVALGSGWGTVRATAGGGTFGNVFALRADGSVMTGGYTYLGSMGLGPVGDNQNVPGPVPVLAETCTALPCADVLNGVTALAGTSANVTLALKNGRILAWGAANQALMGNAPRTDFPRALANSGAGYTALSAGNAHALVIGPGNAVYSWGSELRDALGRAANTSAPGTAPGLVRVVP